MKKVVNIILIVTVLMLFFAEAAFAATTMSVRDDGTSIAISGDLKDGKLTVDERLFAYTGADLKPSIKGLYINQSIAAYIGHRRFEASIRASVPKDGYSVKYFKRTFDNVTRGFNEVEVTDTIEPGDYRMVLTGNGAFSGELECLFSIYPLPERKENPEIKSIKEKKTTKVKVKDKDKAKDKAKHSKKDESEEPEELTLMFTGDLMCKKFMQEGAHKKDGYNFKPTFKYVKKVFSEADYVVGNLETLVSESMPLNGDFPRMQGRPFLNAPIEFLESLGYAGFKGLVLANNHCCDGGMMGIKETLAAVDAAGFDRVGVQKNEKENRYIMIEKNGYKVAVLSYAVFFNKNDELLTYSEQREHLSRPSRRQIRADIKAVRKAGADYIISYLHCGDEYSQEISERQRKYTERLAEMGVDYIIGSHPHVLQRAEVITVDGKKGRKVPCVYSMGNFISDFPNEMCKETAILKLTLKKTKKGKVKLGSDKFIPCYMADSWDGKSYVLIPKGYEDTDKKKAKEYSIKEHFRSAIETLKVI